MEIIRTADAPQAIGPYSQGVVVPAGDWVFTAGQIGLDPRTGEIVPGGAAEEFLRAVANVEAILRSAGCGLRDVVKATLYFADLKDFAAVNEAYALAFPPPHPARSAIEAAALPKGARIEIDVIARRPQS